MNDIAISINNLVKEYEVYARPADVALEILTRRARHTTFRALDNVSFEVRRGEVLGIIGSNGAGKSTLLKIITGVLDATSGSVEVAGRVTAILELGLGFNTEYSGRQNIYLSGLLYGMDRAEIDEKLESIIDFSGLREFIERPVKTYSSGMQSRLAFSIATAVDPDILIIDEALAAGDAAFVQKCLRRIRQLCSGGRTVLLVSHGTGLLAQLCQRVAWLEHGRVKLLGSAIEVVQAYDLASHQSADSNSWIETIEDSLEKTTGEPGAGGEGALAVGSPDSGPPLDLHAVMRGEQSLGQQVFRRGPVFIESVELLDGLGARTNRLVMCRAAFLLVHYRVEGTLPEESLGIAISINNRSDLSPIAQYFTQNIRPSETRELYKSAPERRKPAKTGTICVRFDSIPFRKGEYFLSLGLLPNEPGSWHFYEYRHFHYVFTVDDAGLDVGAPLFLDLRMTHRHCSESQTDSDLTAQPTFSAANGGDTPPTESLPEAASFMPEQDSEPSTLRSEIAAICFDEGGYPDCWPRHKTCPACGSGNLRHAFNKYGFSHDQCDGCAFVCVNPYPPNDVLARLYDGAYYTHVRELFELPRLIAGGGLTPFSAPELALEKIVVEATKDKAAGAWLDVGGGLGVFANLIATLRPDWHVSLNEMNRSSVAIATNLARGRFQVTDADADALLAAGKRYDVISSVAVLEHVPDPRAFLESYIRLLKPGGVLVTVVPNFTRLNAAVSKGSSANAVPPFHVSLFGETALRAVIDRLTDMEAVAFDQAGPASFRLIDHVAFGDHWDITIPTPEQPEPKSIMVAAYDGATTSALNVLSEADKKLGSFFEKFDGKLYLISFYRRKV